MDDYPSINVLLMMLLPLLTSKQKNAKVAVTDETYTVQPVCDVIDLLNTSQDMINRRSKHRIFLDNMER